MKSSGCTVIEYLMFVNTNASVAGMYRTSSSGSAMAAPRRHAAQTPITNSTKIVADAAYARRYTRRPPVNCCVVFGSSLPSMKKTRSARYTTLATYARGSRRMLSTASAVYRRIS